MRAEFENDLVEEQRIAAFTNLLSEKDMMILKMRMERCTEQEIAKKVSYQTASAVQKRIQKIAKAYEAFVSDEYKEFLDHLPE